MIWFSDRHKLEKHFEKWAKENHATICPLNVITWLLSNNMLNEYTILEYLKENKQ